MKKTKGYYLRLWQNTGFIIIVLGAIIAFFAEYVGAIIAVIGILINVFPCLMGKVVYICPECKTRFGREKDKITLQTSNWPTHWSFLTCPKCKKKNWCRTKLISKEEL